MKYLVNYLKICKRHSEYNCNGCPFNEAQIKTYDCHRWIIEHQEEAKGKIVNYVTERKASKCAEQHVVADLRGQNIMTINGAELERECCNCNKIVRMDIRDVVWDDYICKNVWVCPTCTAENNLT